MFIRVTRSFVNFVGYTTRKTTCYVVATKGSDSKTFISFIL